VLEVAVKRLNVILGVSLGLCIALSACGNPKNIVFGPEPLKQIGEQGDKFKKLSKEDRELLVEYLMTAEVGEIAHETFGTQLTPMRPVTGKTVGEVLDDAREWKAAKTAAEEAAEAARLKREAEEKALREKAIAEAKAISDRMAASVVVAIVNKKVHSQRFGELLMFDYAIQNKSDKGIRQIKGVVRCTDATGDEIGWLKDDIDTDIAPGQTVKTDTGSGWEVNQFRNSSIEKIAARDSSDMKVTFYPTSIAFDDGEVLKVEIDSLGLNLGGLVEF
jgi:hypothetical protein